MGFEECTDDVSRREIEAGIAVYRRWEEGQRSYGESFASDDAARELVSLVISAAAKARLLRELSL